MHDSNSSDQNHLEQCKEIAEREREKERESWRELYDHLSIPLDFSDHNALLTRLTHLRDREVFSGVY